MTSHEEHGSGDLGSSDDVERDPAALNSAEDLDEDRLRLDPLEAGMDPPDRWSGADKYGMTPYEQANSRPLTDRLAEEQPDFGAGDATGQAGPDGLAGEDGLADGNGGDGLDGLDTVGDRAREPLSSLRDEALRAAVSRGQAADEARGTAEGIPDKEI